MTISGRSRFRFSEFRFDWPLFLSCCALGLIGIINLYSATSVGKTSYADMHIQQIYWFVIGGIFASVIAIIDYRHYERLGYAMYGAGIILLILVFILGKDIRGSSRWIFIGSFSLQPSEFTKMLMVVALAKYFHNDAKSGEGRTLRDMAIPAVMVLVPTVLIYKQPDLGTALIHVLIFLSLSATVRIRWKSIAVLILGLGIFSPLVWSYVLHDYQKERITSFLNPETNIKGAGWHAYHARTAIGHGGLFGQGFMKGSQNQYLFIPDQHSDFPFAVFAEDWGFFGCLILIAIYTFIVLWAMRVAYTAKDRFGSIVATGVASLVFWHAFFNLGMVTGILPVVGVPLPLFSAGGSGILTILFGIGMLMNVSMRRTGLVDPS